ncbi:MAG: hypothetical protein N2545_02965 [Thermoflexales bacterium]|nr:hypothetical protein [Thermoflexales bacterium]
MRAKVDRLRRLADAKQRIAASVMLIAEAVRSRLARYPRSVVYPVRWKSLRQRAAYFARMRALGERPPYRRSISRGSERLGKSYRAFARGTRAVVRSTASYSAFVQAARAQQPFHRATGWTTDAEAIRETLQDTALQRRIEELLA